MAEENTGQQQGNEQATLFHPENRNLSPAHAKIWAAFEVASTVVDFTAAGLFIVGSALFFKESTTYVATWMFLVGSFFFGLKPAIRLVRELKFLSMGKVDEVARRFKP